MVCLDLIARARRAENTRGWGFSCTKLLRRIPRGIGAHIKLGQKKKVKKSKTEELPERNGEQKFKMKSSTCEKGDGREEMEGERDRIP